MKKLFIALAVLLAVGCSKSEGDLVSPITITNKTSHVWHDLHFWSYDENPSNPNAIIIIRSIDVNKTVEIGASVKVPSYDGKRFSIFFRDGDFDAFSSIQTIQKGVTEYSVYDNQLYR